MGRSTLDDIDLDPNGQAGDMIFGANTDPTSDPLKQAAAKDAQVQPQPATGDTVQGDPSTSGKGKAIVDAAMTQLGVKYVYGAHQWGQALDCSGLTMMAAQHAGIQVGGNTYSQVKQGTAVQGGLANAQPGDFVFTVGDIGMKMNGHVAIYIGGGKVIAAPRTGSVVSIQDWSNRGITAIRRYV